MGFTVSSCRGIRVHGMRAIIDSEEAGRARQDRSTQCDQARAIAARWRPVSGVCAQRGRRSIRDLARAWVSAKDDLKRARQRLKAFLLSHGVGYTGRADWGPSHRRWLSTYAFDSPWQQLALEELRRTIEDRLTQCERLEAALREAVLSWRFYPAVLGLQTMSGVQFTTAAGMLAELGDLSRFAHPRQLMAWMGGDAVRALLRREAPSGRHHQERQ